ncbi:MAG: ABC transporter substrate-binding protein [Gammaproteobacteria bacterium]
MKSRKSTRPADVPAGNSAGIAPIDRRRFLQLSGAALAAQALPQAARAQDKNVMVARTYADMTSMDPAFSIGVIDEEIHGSVYSKLIQFRPGRKWTYDLDAAASIKQVGDKEIRFTLKRGIQFTHGYGTMTAEDVKYSFERVISPALKSSIKPDWGTLSEVRVDGEYEGTIVFKSPFQPAWNIALPYSAGNIVSKKAWEKAGGKVATTAPCFSGPYIPKEWSPKQRTVLARNPDWHGGRAAFDEIHLRPIDDENTAQIAFEAGDVDYTRVSLGALKNLRANPPANSTIAEYPSLYYVWLGMNLDNPATSNIHLRRAVQYAVDVPSIMQAAYFGVAKPSTGIIAPGLPGHRARSLVPPKANLAEARRQLKKAGLQGGVTLTLDILNKATNVTAAQVIQANCAQAGITIVINLNESGAFWSLGDESKGGERWKNVQLILNRYSMTPDPYYATSWFTTEQVGVWNWERFRSADFDIMHKRAAGESDPASRAALYERMQDLMEESGAYRFITHEATPVIYRNTIAPAFRPDGLPLFRSFRRA